MLCGKNKRRTKGKTTQMLYDNLRGVFGFPQQQGFRAVKLNIPRLLSMYTKPKISIK